MYTKEPGSPPSAESSFLTFGAAVLARLLTMEDSPLRTLAIIKLIGLLAQVTNADYIPAVYFTALLLNREELAKFSIHNEEAVVKFIDSLMKNSEQDYKDYYLNRLDTQEYKDFVDELHRLYAQYTDQPENPIDQDENISRWAVEDEAEDKTEEVGA